MSDPAQHVVVRLAIAVGVDPVAGVLTVGDQPPHDFRSWLELIAALDSANSGALAQRP